MKLTYEEISFLTDLFYESIKKKCNLKVTLEKIRETSMYIYVKMPHNNYSAMFFITNNNLMIAVHSKRKPNKPQNRVSSTVIADATEQEGETWQIDDPDVNPLKKMLKFVDKLAKLSKKDKIFKRQESIHENNLHRSGQCIHPSC